MCSGQTCQAMTQQQSAPQRFISQDGNQQSNTMSQSGQQFTPSLNIYQLKCQNCSSPSHLQEQCPQPILCQGCGQEGHRTSECQEGLSRQQEYIPLYQRSPEEKLKRLQNYAWDRPLCKRRMQGFRCENIAQCSNKYRHLLSNREGVTMQQGQKLQPPLCGPLKNWSVAKKF